MLTLTRAPLDLRNHLTQVITQPHNGSHGYGDVANSTSASPNDHGIIDPAINGQGGMMSAGGDSGGEDGDGRKGGKRELSQSKRAAQNRAAQVRFFSSLGFFAWRCSWNYWILGLVKKDLRWSGCFLIFLSSRFERDCWLT